MKKLSAFALVLALALLAGCGESKDDSTATTATACEPGALPTESAGVLTVATDKPAYPPYFEDNDPTTGEGFESAVAYAIGKQLGYPPAKVKWTVEPFNSSFAPGPKDFDFDVNEISITPPRQKAVDFSSPYYTANQAVVALKDSDAAKATSLADLQGREHRRPDRHHQPFGDGRHDRTGQQAGSLQQLQRRGHGAEERTDRRRRRRPADGALHHRRPGPDRDRGRPVRRPGRRRVGRPLAKDSPLTACISEAVEQLKSSGELEKITQRWMSQAAGAPELD